MSVEQPTLTRRGFLQMSAAVVTTPGLLMAVKPSTPIAAQTWYMTASEVQARMPIFVAETEALVARIGMFSMSSEYDGCLKELVREFSIDGGWSEV